MKSKAGKVSVMEYFLTFVRSHLSTLSFRRSSLFQPNTQVNKPLKFFFQLNIRNCFQLLCFWAFSTENSARHLLVFIYIYARYSWYKMSCNMTKLDYMAEMDVSKLFYEKLFSYYFMKSYFILVMWIFPLSKSQINTLVIASYLFLCP